MHPGLQSDYSLESSAENLKFSGKHGTASTSHSPTASLSEPLFRFAHIFNMRHTLLVSCQYSQLASVHNGKNLFVYSLRGIAATCRLEMLSFFPFGFFMLLMFLGISQFLGSTSVHLVVLHETRDIPYSMAPLAHPFRLFV
ncbi:hypothetical protein QYF36_011158 [Acer negundo]|nr:hypothetical protein QYF36_011158 [Acer negundo]